MSLFEIKEQAVGRRKRYRPISMNDFLDNFRAIVQGAAEFDRRYVVYDDFGSQRIYVEPLPKCTGLARKVDVDLAESTLNDLCKYVLSGNRLIIEYGAFRSEALLRSEINDTVEGER